MPESAFVVETISPVYHFVGSFDTAAIIREAMAIQQKPGFEDKEKLARRSSSFCFSPETATIAGHTEICGFVASTQKHALPNREQYVRLRSHPHPDSSPTPSRRPSLALSPEADCWDTTDFY